MKRAEANYVPRAMATDAAALKKEGNGHFTKGNPEAAARSLFSIHRSMAAV